MRNMIRVVAVGTAVAVIAWATLADTPDAAAQGQGRGAGAAPVAPASKPAPARDISGVWMKGRAPQGITQFNNAEWTPGIPPPLTEWGKAEMAKSKPNNSGQYQLHETNDPVLTRCYPPGVPRVYFHPYPFELIQVNNAVLQVFEYDHFLRRFPIGRELPADPDQLWMGTSSGRWVNDTTFEVTTIGFNTKTWLDRAGAPHSEQLKVTETFRRTAFDTLQLDIRMEDPKVLAKPWVTTGYFELRPGWEIGEISCSGDYLEWPGA